MKTTTTLRKWMLLVCTLTIGILPLQAEYDDNFFGIFCPDDVYADCDDELWDLSIYGNAYYKDYHGTHDAGEPVVKYYLNQCNTGHITRTWTVHSYSTISCTQTIYVGGGGGFNEDNIHWPPAKIEVTGCNPSLEPDYLQGGKPTWDYADCSMIGYTFKDTHFKVSNSCKKVIRKWTLMDWCEYDPKIHPTKGLYTYNQTIKIYIDEIPTYTCPGDISVESYDCKEAEVLADFLEVDPSVCGGEFTVTNNSPYAYTNGPDISGVYPLGETWVKYTIKYGCGQTKTCEIKVVVKDAKPPTPYCYAYMTVSLMGMDNDDDGINDEGMVEIWAKDLDAGSFANCGDDDLQFSFSSDVQDKAITFTCEDVGQNVVEMWVTDKGGNQNYCLVTLFVQNNSANIQNCEREDNVSEEEEEVNSDEEGIMFSAAGRVSTIYGAPVENASIDLIDMEGEMIINATSDTIINLVEDSLVNNSGNTIYTYYLDTIIHTNADTTMNYQSAITSADENGFFEFQGMIKENGNYKLQAKAEDIYSEELTIDDALELFFHVTGDKPFTNQHQFLASDLDGDGNISFMDLRYLLLYISERSESFPIGYGSIIVNADLTYDDPAAAIGEGIPDYYMLEVVSGDQIDKDFFLIKMGDLVDTAPEAERRSISTRSDIDFSDWIDLSEKELEAKFLEITGAAIPHITIQAAPNPFERNTLLRIQSDQECQSSMQIYSMDGKLIQRHQVNIHQGYNQLNIDLQDQYAGVYFYQLLIDDKIYTGKMIKK